MNAPVTSLTARRKQENLAWESNAIVADYLTARLSGDKNAEMAAIKAAREIDQGAKSGPRLMDEINALRTRRSIDAA